MKLCRGVRESFKFFFAVLSDMAFEKEAFEKDKQNALTKQDKSRKGAVDREMRPLVKLLNSKPNYYTTSSCAGRILLISFPEDNRKYNVKWLYLSHSPAGFRAVKSNIDKAVKSNIKNDVWLKQESVIAHVCCKTLEDASGLIEAAKHAGFKRSGINAARKKIVVELLSTENMDVPVIKKGKLLVGDAYLRIVVKEANKKLKRTKEKIKLLSRKLQLPALLSSFFSFLL